MCAFPSRQAEIMHAKLRAGVSASATFGGWFVLLVGATGTGSVATSPTLGATCSRFLATSGARAF